MSDLALCIRDLTKVYPLYASPQDRALGMFGLFRPKQGEFTTHIALENVNLDIKHGETLGIIGRNGAGKSTLLKLISGVTKPTSGTIEKNGEIYSLLELGTTFHPDFTGRENVLSHLSLYGIGREVAEERYRDIVEFAELEEYINQPIKTYSTGMQMRLKFATSIAVQPDILVLDEVLSVGDAYFTRKSFEKVQEMVETKGTTVLLVSHDIYSVSKLCRRVIWLDAGRVVIDGETPVVVDAYEDSIRQQEERRIRRRKQERIKDLQAGGGKPAKNETYIMFEIRSAHNDLPKSLVYFSSIELSRNGEVLGAFPIVAEENAFNETLPCHLVKDGSNWGPVSAWQDRRARPLRNFGSTYNKVSGGIRIPSRLVADGAGDAKGGLALKVASWMDQASDLDVVVWAGRREIKVGKIPQDTGIWNESVFEFDLPDSAAPAKDEGFDLEKKGAFGSGNISIVGVRTLDHNGSEGIHWKHGNQGAILIDYRINDPEFDQKVDVYIGFKKDGTQDICRYASVDLNLSAKETNEGVIRLQIPKILLTDGSYFLTVMIADEGYLSEPQEIFYTVNPKVFSVINQAHEIIVSGSGFLGANTFLVNSGEWSLQ